MTKSASGPKPSGDDQRDVIAAATVEVPPRPGQRDHRGHRDVLLEDLRRGARASAASVEDDVVGRRREGEVDVGLDVLGAELEPDRDTARALADLVGELGEVGGGVEIGERRGADRGRARLELPDLGDLALHLLPRQMPASAGLGPLPALEVERLHAFDLLQAPAELGRRQLIEVAGVGCVLLGQHAALA